MILLNTEEDNQMMELLTLIDYEVDYFRDCLETMKKLQSDLSSCVFNNIFNLVALKFKL